VLGWEGPDSAKAEVVQRHGEAWAARRAVAAQSLNGIALAQFVDVGLATPAPSRARKSATASAKRGSRSQCAECVHTGSSAARHLVLSLCAALEAAKPLLQAPLQRLVVAGLEVQARHVLDAAPVAARRPRLRQRSMATSDAPTG
jgi:hypothetical protein